MDLDREINAVLDEMRRKHPDMVMLHMPLDEADEYLRLIDPVGHRFFSALYDIQEMFWRLWPRRYRRARDFKRVSLATGFCHNGVYYP